MDDKEFLEKLEKLRTLDGHEGFKVFLETIEADIEGFDMLIVDSCESMDNKIFTVTAQKLYAERLLTRLSRWLAAEVEEEEEDENHTVFE